MVCILQARSGDVSPDRDLLMMEIFASWVNGDGQITPWSSRRRLWLEPAQPATQQMDHEAEQHQTRAQPLQRSGVLIEQDGSHHHADAGHQQAAMRSGPSINQDRAKKGSMGTRPPQAMRLGREV